VARGGSESEGEEDEWEAESGKSAGRKGVWKGEDDQDRKTEELKGRKGVGMGVVNCF
jgi:hypothetical protein